MKFATALLLIASVIGVISAHAGMLYPPPRGGVAINSIQKAADYDGRFHAFIGYKQGKKRLDYPCGGYQYDPNRVTTMKAGQTINVRFFASAMNKDELNNQPTLPNNTKKQFPQARHGGGTCEFSLSYDNGNSFYRIAKYTKTCPDSYFDWPVKIPKDIPSCTEKGKCLFVWTWTANTVTQFYMNCADISLEGAGTGGPPKGTSPDSIKIVDFKPDKMRDIPKDIKIDITNDTEPGDGIKHEASTGPTKMEIDYNLEGKYYSV
ncbi:hypothetical protein BGX28_010403 [Mortierella sp. GBA30]|nr:hypothetical protein BGX28_010403 [Mortierella sp. GBA30]